MLKETDFSNNTKKLQSKLVLVTKISNYIKQQQEIISRTNIFV